MERGFEVFKEDDIRPALLFEETQSAYAEDIKWLTARREKFVEVSCPACESDKKTFHFEKNGFKYHKCSACRTVYISPRPSVKLMSEFYENSKGYEFWAKKVFPASDQARIEKIYKPRANDIIELCKKHGIKNHLMVEVGAGFGSFAKTMTEANFFDSILIIEPNLALAEKCREKGLKVINSVVEEAKLDAKADVIVSFEVIEHLFSAMQFILQCKELLHKTGMIVFSCPNMEGFDNLCLGIHSSTIDHEHVNYFNPESLSLLFDRCGFDVIEVYTPGKLDAELVRNHALKDQAFLKGNPFLEHILLEKWPQFGNPFQKFLAENQLSGHMWIVARTR